LQARIEILGPVRPGTLISYVVELTNPTTTDVVLSPCPGYRQIVSDAIKTRWAQSDYSLNCNAVGVVRAATSTRLAMRIETSPALTGPSYLVWHLDTGPAATTNLTIE
jgi:hypothetical protein